MAEFNDTLVPAVTFDRVEESHNGIMLAFQDLANTSVIKGQHAGDGFSSVPFVGNADNVCDHFSGYVSSQSGGINKANEAV